MRESIAPNAPAVWGDMFVYSQGVRIAFDSPFLDSRSLSKSGFLIYEGEILKSLAVCRTVDGLTPEELRDREKQIGRSVHPGVLRRGRRSVSNLINVVRDAIMNTLSLFIGRMTGKGQMGAAVKGQTGKISEIGSSVLDVMANAYEPLLERHIGKPVILEIRYPEGAPLTSSEFPGYLADYNEKFIALFNPDHKPEEAIEISARETTELTGCTLELAGHAVSVVCTGPDAIVVKRLVLDSEQMDMAAVLLASQRLTFHRHSVERVQMTAARTRRLDLVCPRTRAQVRFTSTTPTPARKAWSGIAPELEVPSDQ